MKKALLAAVITRIGGTEFADGQQQVKISLEDGYSFNVPPTSALLPKIDVGYELDLTFNGSKENRSTTQSGAEFVFHNLNGVKVIGVKAGEVDEILKSLPDVAAGRVINFKQVGAAGSASTAAPAKV